MSPLGARSPPHAPQPQGSDAAELGQRRLDGAAGGVRGHCQPGSGVVLWAA